MTLTKYKLGELIEQTTEINSNNRFGPDSVRGMTITKEIIPTKADVSNTDLIKFLIINPNEFVYNPRTHGKKIGLGYNLTNMPFIISWNNTGFRIKDSVKKIIMPEYLFLHFNRSEWDRQACFHSWGSSTEVFSWEALCGMELLLPPIDIQKKYVAIYQAMLANQQSYEKGLEDLKIVFDGILDKEKFVSDKQPVKKLLEEVDERNEDGLLKDVLGINVNKEFMPSVANVKNIDLSRYKIVKSGQLAFSGMQTGRDQCIRIALNKSKNPILISPAYTVFKIKTKAVIAEYIMMWFSRAESDRKGWFMSDSSIRSNLDLERFYETQIPVPDLKRQHGVANIYSVYKERQHINEKLKEQIKKICPILIKGSLEEAGI